MHEDMNQYLIEVFIMIYKMGLKITPAIKDSIFELYSIYRKENLKKLAQTRKKVLYVR